jgi:hypothetical protein
MRKIIFPMAISYSVLGFYRGTQQYKYEYNRELQRYNKNIEQYNKYNITYRKPYFFYSDSFGNGLWGTFCYINPAILPLIIAKEIYRLEVYMRNDLNELKNQDEYYKLF